MNAPIYHLAEPGDWARSTETYEPSTFAQIGFIHCSRAEQVAPVARNLYRNHNGLILLTIDPSGLPEGALVDEGLDGDGDEYPHLYAPLPTATVTATGPYLTHLEEGLWLDTRWDREWMDRMLHPDFTEVGSSGRLRHRQESIDTAQLEYEIELPLEGCTQDSIDEDVAMIRYISRTRNEGVEAPAHRTSIWVNTNEGWRLRFHQGTPLP